MHQQTHPDVSFFVCTFQRLLMDFHYRSPSAKPSTTGSVQVVWASSQWDACLTTYSERKITCGRNIEDSLPWRFRAQRPPITWYCSQRAVGPGCDPAQLFSQRYRHHNFQILPQQCLLSEIILYVA